VQKILVAGSTGYLGKYIVKELKEQGYWVRGLARNPKKLEQTGPFLEPAVIDLVDEVFIGQVTKPETLYGLCDDIDIVFSSIGITRQKGKLTYRNVDYQGNRNILNIALGKSVKKFLYVSVFNAHMFKHLEIVKAHEDFVRDLQDCGLDYAIIRPTGYFSDMSEFLRMAKSGRVYLIGDGENRRNPIHGADLAKVCVDAVTSNAFSTLGKRAGIILIPPALANLVVRMIRPFNRQMSDFVEFFLTAAQNDGVAPATGRHTLESFYQEMASRWIRDK